MKPKLLLLAALLPILLLLAPSAAQAQFGVYPLFTANRLSGTDTSPLALPLPVTPPYLTAYRSSVNPSGFTGGLYYDFKPVGPVLLGVDVRGTLTHNNRGAQSASIGSGVRADSILGGVRATFHPRITALAPYVQGSAGLGRSNFGLGTTRLNNGFEYHAYAGLDIHVVSFFDFRAAELGYGAISSGGHTYPIASISTGVVFHLPKLP